MAPEILQNQEYDYRIDIWSLGILLYELMHGFTPFKNQNERETSLNVMKNSSEIQLDKSLSPEVCDLIQSLLKPDPNERISMEDVFRHPWLKKYEKVYNIDINTFLNQLNDEFRNSSSSEESNARPRFRDTKDTENDEVSNINSKINQNNKYLTSLQFGERDMNKIQNCVQGTNLSSFFINSIREIMFN